MIKIDGKMSDRKIGDFANLEELIKGVMDAPDFSGRVVTDVLINNEPFSEIYPHQAEDMECNAIESVEIRTMPEAEMAVNVAGEMGKVALMMGKGARSVARLFREGQDADALELFQDLLDVTRDFMAMLSLLRDSYLGGADEAFVSQVEEFSNLISEMSEVLENEDWTLLADLLEFEFAPACDEWRKVGAMLHKQLEKASR